MRLESFSGILLILCLTAALLLANSAWSGPYFRALHHELGWWSDGRPVLAKSLQHWINDGLMAIFFFVVGLEIKREFLGGELAGLRRALLPLAAALGGMAMPALIYLGFNPAGVNARGWGIPMATDIAFALGILSLLGRRVPVSMKVVLSALAIIDDLGAVLVIALFYTGDLSPSALGMAGIVFGALVLCNRFRVRFAFPYLVLGLFLWHYLMLAGIHGTIAGVLSAWTIPAASPRPDEESLLHKLERRVLPWSSFVILPLFALANAGIAVDAGLFRTLGEPIGLGILAGLVVGKPLGIFLACRLALQLGWAAMPAEAGYRHILGVGMLGGIGFTMSIFIAGLAFTGEGLDSAKLAIFLASLVAGVCGLAFLYFQVLPERSIHGKEGPPH